MHIPQQDQSCHAPAHVSLQKQPVAHLHLISLTRRLSFVISTLVILVSLPSASHSQCDAEVSGVLTYCNSFIGSGGNVSVLGGYFVGFRVTSQTGDTLNVIDVNGAVPMNRGKRIDNIDTQNEPNDTTRVPLRIAGGMDTIEYWYFGPYPNNVPFNVALVDPNGQCDTVFVASGTFSCADFTPYTDPGACDGDVPLYFLDFAQNTFQLGGGGGGNENVDEIFLIMARTRENVCCDLQPANSNCFEFVIRLGPNDIGLIIDDVGSGSTGGKIYADSLSMFACTGNPGTTWPFQQDNGQSSDITPLCLAGGVTDWLVLSCKPGGNVTNVSIDAIASPFSPPRVTIEPCNVLLEVIDADSAYWTSPDDPMLLNLDTCSTNNLSCSFLYDVDTFGEVSVCEGDTFVYIAGGRPIAAECFALDTIIFDTTYVVVYPVFDVEIEAECNTSNDSLVLSANAISLAMGCSYLYDWSTGATTQSITVMPDGAEYSVTITRADFPPGAEMCVMAADTANAFAVFATDCSAVQDMQFACAEDVPAPDTSLVVVDGCGDPLIYSTDFNNNGSGCIDDTLFITRLYIVDFDADTVLTTEDRDTCTQLFTIVDVIPPVLSCPVDITLECTDAITTDVTGTATATDNCAGIAGISFADSTVSGACTGTQIILRTWTAMDQCGNIATCVQSITQEDTTPPEIMCPSYTTISCEESTDPANTGTATATDACDAMPTVEFADTTVTGSCPQEQTINRTWTATDACGNTATCLQVITVQDEVAPAITCPPDITILCTEDSGPANTGFATATDNCDLTPTISFGDVVTPGACPQSRTILRVWFATDDCGNTNGCGQTIVVIDNMAPVISCPPDTVVNCETETSPMSLGFATATDDCASSVSNITSTDSIIQGNCEHNYMIARTWTATDSCGNSSSCLQTIMVQDTTAPVMICPADLTLECTDSTSPDNTGFATATDNCALTPFVTYMDVVDPGACASGAGISRIWTASDECGNTSSCVQTILIQDETPPAVVCPADVTIQCGTSSDPAITGTATATDACDINPQVAFVDTISPGNCIDEMTINRTWTATDACGNTSTCVQSIFVVDTIAPSIDCPDDITIACTESSAPANTGTATATDNCDTQPDVTFNDIVIAGICPNASTINRTWTATDNCGNTTSCVQIIAIVDTTGPTISCPADVTVQCNTDLSTDVLGMATATDDCGQVFVTFFGDVGSGQACDSTILRTFIATDACGNTATCVQQIRILDEIAPGIICPETIFLECGIDTIPVTMATATDNCTVDPSVTYSDEEFTQICSAGVVVDGQTNVRSLIVRTFIATDDCGNTSSCTQHILIRDDTPPMLTCPPDVTIACGQDINDLQITGTGIAVDLCDPDAFATILITIEQPGGNSCVRVFERLWAATDNCGNGGSSEICSQFITVIDTTPPDMTCPPDITIGCSDSSDPMNTGEATAVDSCSPLLPITYADAPAPGGCSGTTSITRTWTASDVCGNTRTCVQNIVIGDIVSPEIFCPADTTVECGTDTSPAFLGMASATDDCTMTVTAITSADTIVSGSCEGNYTILRTWTAVDSCGNSSTCVQMIEVVDTNGPVITCPPDTTSGCGGSLSPLLLGSASAIDACSGEVPEDRITFADNLTPGDCEVGLVIVRTWYAEDHCGNTTSCTQHIIVSDDAPPMIFCPASPPVECGGGNLIPPYASLEEFLAGGGMVDDDCGVDSLSFTLISETSSGADCGSIIRVYSIADACGSTATCAQEIAVNDSEAPMIFFPSDMIPVCCPELVIEFPDIPAFVDAGGSVSDDCGIDSSSFALLTEVTIAGDCNDHVIQTYVVSDLCGNTATAEVHYIVDRDPGAAVLVCRGQVQVSLDVNCKATITPELLLITFEGCSEDFEIKPKPGYTLLPGNMVDGSYVGQTIPIMVIDPLSGNRCWSYVTIEDKLPPVLTCAADTVPCSASTDPVVLGFPVRDGVTFIANGDGTFTATDLETCGPVLFEYYDETFFEDCSTAFERIVYRNWRATDASGNISTCQDTIYVRRLTLDGVVLPAHYDDTEQPALECGGPCILPDGTPYVICTGEPSGVTCDNIIVTRTDQRFPTCGGSYIVHRNWRLVDMCAGEDLHFIQRIKVRDRTPPVIVCQDTIFAFTAGVQCVASVPIPVPSIVDACSEFSYSVWVSAGVLSQSGGQYVVSQLPPGNHVLRYTAKDACFNQSTCVSIIHVADRSAPVAVCDQHSIVTLSPQKLVTTISALSLSDHSYDACSHITVYGRRMTSCIDFDWTTLGTDDMPDGSLDGYDLGTAFNTHIPFACCDIGAGPLMIEIQIVDASGNTARCMVEVTVQDKSGPDIICPPDIRVSCGTVIDSTALYDISDRTFGTVLNGLIYSDADRQPVVFEGENWGLDGIAFDNCALELDLEVLDLRDVCGAGEIRRTFTATDPSNGSVSCTQVITVEIADAFSREDILWPPDMEVEGTCGMDPVISGRPEMTHVSCDLTAAQYKDLITGPVDGACAKILRTWYVIDWCQYDGVSGDGIWEHVQTIKVLNSAGPEYANSCSTITLCQDDPGVEETLSCVATVTRSQIVSDDCTTPDKLKWQYALDLYGDGSFEYTSPLQTGAGPNAIIVGSSLHITAILPDLPFNDPDDGADHHVLRWMARDDCGNDRICAESIRLADCKSPVPVCQTLIQPLAPDGTAEIWASDFNASSSDNCTEEVDLRYSFSATEIISSMTFDCEDIIENGGLDFAIPVWVWDAWDNVASCIPILTLQDPMQICDEIPNLTISGHVATAFGEPVELVYTALQGGMSAEFMTSENGDYLFDHVPMMHQYEITPHRNDDPKNGVTTLDLILIQKHLLGLQPFTVPYAFIAADINRSKNVSALDLIELRKLILGIYTEFPNNTSWRFLGAETTFADPDHPFDFPESIVIGALADHATAQDFIAVKIGDLNGTVQANTTQVITRNTVKQASLKLHDRVVHADEEVLITFEGSAMDQLLGLQGFIELYGLQYREIHSEALEVSGDNVAEYEEGIAISWSTGIGQSTPHGANALFTLRVVAKADGRLSDMVQLNPGRISPEIYRADATGGIETFRMGLVFADEKKSDSDLPFALYQNVPNPWQEETSIRFDLPRPMTYTLTVYDVMGLPKHVQHGTGSAGSNYVRIRSKAFPGDEILYYSLVAEEYAAVKKTILSQ